MTKTKPSFDILSPNRKLVLIVLLAWFIGSSLTVLAITDLFTQPFFQGRYLVSHFYLLTATLTTAIVVAAYFRKRQKRKDTLTRSRSME